MVLKNILAALICTALLAWSGLVVADEYRADEFLGLDLSRALLSPKPLGPPAEFVPVQVEARTDRGSDGAAARMEPNAEPNIVIPKTRVAHMRAEKPRGAVRTKLARRRSNPLDAQAFDTRIQVVDANPRPWNAVIEDLGFTPTVRVEFRLDKFTDMSDQKDDMIRLVSDLLDRIPGDAVLHFQYEQIWLLRRNGELSLSEQDDIWPSQRLAAVHQPFRRATYAFS